ncbi:unnamed protein product [Discula destructiva]
MAEHGDTAVLSPSALHTLETKPSSSVMDDSDKENDSFEDTFEDATNGVAPDSSPDTSSVRSLTQRSISGSKPPAPVVEIKEQEKHDKDVPVEEIKVLSPIQPSPTVAAASQVAEPVPAPASAEEKAEANDDLEKADTSPAQSADEVTLAQKRLSVQSNGQLDEVSLYDEVPSDGVKEQEAVKMSPIEPDPSEPPKKSLSLSSITSSLPAMPWSPAAQGQTSPKNLDAAAPVAAAASTSPGTPPATGASAPAAAPAPPPTARKLAGAFSWLSRSSSKDLTNAMPPVVSPRRNTASSTGTLDEEGRSKHSLKDRFKAMRMREEAGITSLPDDGEPNGIATLVNKGLNGTTPTLVEEEDDTTQPPASPQPPLLRPGTASGAAAGPTEVAVDWDLWQSVVNEGPAAVAKTSAEELSKAIATGIPSAIRGVIWQVLAQSQSEELEAVYRDLVVRGTDKEKDRQSNGSLSLGSKGSSLKEPDSSASSVHSNHSGTNGPPTPPPKDTPKESKEDEATRQRRKKADVEMISRLEKVIRRDLGARTAYSKFASAPGLQEGLYGVCKAYALYDEEVGYAQGMNFLIMPLLFNMAEEEAFCLLVKLMNNYHLRDLFVHDMPGLHMHLYQFERLLEDTQPALYCHLRRRGISPHLYATQWFLTLFSYRFPLQLVLRIYDLILSEGLSAILKFGIVLMQKNADTLLGMTDMSHLTNYLRDRLFDVYIESAPSASSILENGFFGSSTSSMDKEVYRADQLVHDACEVKITPEVLQAYRTEWEEKTREETERQKELETLRSQNNSYSSKIRKLEERLQAVDKEQAELATELVHTKVENQELKDQNESLLGQVRELKIVIEKQPAELENQWKPERDALMQNNQRVHEENEKLEKECADLEEQLVATKMQYAEINAQHETLNRKWNDLKRTFA